MRWRGPAVLVTVPPLHQGGRAMQWRIGDVTVTKIVELEVTGGSRFLLPQATYEEILPIAWLRPHFADARGRLKMIIHALVL
jgi:hypothetical protein